MDETTVLDIAHKAMEQGDDAARLRFYECLADNHLFVLLKHDAEGDNISPDVFETAEGKFVLVFDQDARMVHFTGQVTPYARLSGRILMQMLAGQGIGLGLNLEVAPSSILIPASAIDWMNRTLAHTPDHVTARVTGCSPPLDVDERLTQTLRDKLRVAVGLAHAAWLVEATYATGAKGLLLGFVDAQVGAEPALAKAASEAVVFAAGDTARLDVGFFAASEPMVTDLAKAGWYFEIPSPVRQKTKVPLAPGSNPDKPPILR